MVTYRGSAGMVGSRDPHRTRRRILAAARQEFAQMGPAGARVDAMAARAHVNKRMLYHYFQDKNGLFAAVLDDCTEDLLGALELLPEAAAFGSPEVTAALKVLLWALADPANPAARAARRALRPFHEHLADLQARGRVRADLSPDALAALITGYLAMAALLAPDAALPDTAPLVALLKPVADAVKPRFKLDPVVAAAAAPEGASTLPSGGQA